MTSRTKPLLRSALFFLLVGGLLLMLWPAGQSAYGWWSQRALRANWEKTAAQAVSQAPKAAPVKVAAKIPSQKAPQKVEKKKSYAAFPPTRIIIPDINVDAVVLQGMHSGALQRGPGHDPDSVGPGQPGNCVIAAHSNIFGAWFGDLDQLWAGSVIELHTPRHVYNYSVLTSTQISQTDMSVMAPSTDGQAHLTLITCTKPASIYRHVVTAILEEEN